MSPCPTIFPFTLVKNASQHAPGTSRFTSLVQKLFRNVCRSAPVTEILDQPVSSTTARPVLSAWYSRSNDELSLELIGAFRKRHNCILRIFDNHEALMTLGQPHYLIDTRYWRKTQILGGLLVQLTQKIYWASLKRPRQLPGRPTVDFMLVVNFSLHLVPIGVSNEPA